MTIHGMVGDRPGDGGLGLNFGSYVYMPNFKSVGYFLVVDFGGGCSSSSSCDRGKTKSKPCPTWTGLMSLDWSLTIFLQYISLNCHNPNSTAT